MRRTIFTLTHEALAGLQSLWTALVVADDACYVDANEETESALWVAADDWVLATMDAIGVPANEFARRNMAERIYFAVQADEEVGPEVVDAIKWTVNAYYFHTRQGGEDRGGLKENEFSIIAEG